MADGVFISSVPLAVTPTFSDLATLQGDVLHVYAPGAETRDKLEQWKNRLPALTYTWGGTKMIADLLMARLISRGKYHVHSGWFRCSAATDPCAQRRSQTNPFVFTSGCKPFD